MVASTNATPGFLYRWGKFFNNVAMLKILYCALVRPKLEYAAIIWSPHYNIYRDQIERVQHKFLLLATWRMGCQMNYTCHYYRDLLSTLNLIPLSNRRVMSSFFVYKFFNGLLDCPEILSLVNLHSPVRNLRQFLTFRMNNHRTNYGSNSCTSRMLYTVNKYSNHVYLFNMLLDAFRRSLRQVNFDAWLLLFTFSCFQLHCFCKLLK